MEEEPSTKNGLYVQEEEDPRNIEPTEPHQNSMDFISLYDDDEDVQTHDKEISIEEDLKTLSLTSDLLNEEDPLPENEETSLAGRDDPIISNTTVNSSKYVYSESATNTEEESIAGWKPLKQSGSKTSSRKDAPKKKLELRHYQLELAERALRGDNCIIISPTGSGKTHVAIRIIQHHLEKLAKNKKIAFVVDKNNLANQQSEKIEEYLQCRLKVISGDIHREQENVQDIASFFPQYDVFVVTAQMLVNAIAKQNVDIRSFSSLIFDECHHCCGTHPFQKIMNYYMDSKLEYFGGEYQLPQIIGFTASIGLGKSNTVQKTIEHVKTTLANMDADCLVTVQRNKSELEKHMNNPRQYITTVPVRRNDEFGTRIKLLMIKTEKYLDDAGVGFLRPPAAKGSTQYKNWLEDALLKAVAQLSESDANRSLFTLRKYLEIYNSALIHFSHATAIDVLHFIIKEIGNLPKLSGHTGLEQKIKTLLEEEYTTIEACAMDHTRTSENPLLLKLKEIILTTYAENPDMRGIVFVRSRILADLLASWIENTKELERIKALKYTSSLAKLSEGGMTRYEQIDALELFKEGQYKIIVATTVAEEGLDIKECNLVVRYDYVGSAISLVQARGRGRAENSRFYILASEDKCVAEKESLNVLREPMMEEAMRTVQQLIEYNYSVYLAQKREIQLLAKRERDAAKRNQVQRRVVNSGEYYLRCLKCHANLCMSSDIRRILNHHYACISPYLKYNINCTKFETPSYPGDDIEMGVGQIDCIGKGCFVKLGTIALYEGIFYPILNIKALKIENNFKKGDTLKKWNMVEKYFTVPDLSTGDIENIVKSGRLIDFS
ncbi:antiviral innate immune response receptor RIG-I-like [Saccostrea echinata]|uniref:antiviral innate immune response receptor RIG-I-like n=1 Tax=Saccostrea echinata TaxID=191078 RepID=UPI002A7EF099|nr:antiviral innate immune response receptor RIG-I-like [Saccostrea echinata]